MVATRRPQTPPPSRVERSRACDSLPRGLVLRALAARRQLHHPAGQRALIGALVQEGLARRLPLALRPTSYGIGAHNKLFACDWLDRDTVLLGSKCNSLLRLSLLDGALEPVPLLSLPGWSRPAAARVNEGGIHALELNRAGTFLATGALADGDLGVYQLPDMRPHALLHGAHDDWVFDAAWLDHATLLSVARDSSLAVWSLPERNFAGESGLGDSFTVTSPRYRRCLPDLQGQSGAKLRSVDVGVAGDLAVLSLSCFLNFYSPERLDEPVTCVELGATDPSLAKETVCVRAAPLPHCFFSCCVSQVTMYDSRLGCAAFGLESQDRSSGVRSLACNGPVLSYGTGVGNVYFYDCRSRRHLRTQLELPQRAASLGDQHQAQPLFRDHDYLQPNPNSVEYAVYSHRYDTDRTRIFAAGGPLATNFWGNLAVLHS